MTRYDTRIRYEVEGEGEPLVLIDGFSTSLEMWREQGYVDALSTSFRLILIDPRAHGQIDKAHDPTQYRPELMVGDVLAVLDQLEVAKAHYLGASMGAAIGFEIARHAPDRLRSLVLMGYGGYGPPNEAQRRFQTVGLRLEQTAVELGPDAALAALEQMAGPRPEEERARFLANDHQALLALLQAMDEWPGFEDVLPDMTMPSLYLVTEGDPFYEAAKQCAEAMPRARFVTLPSRGHRQTAYGAAAITPYVVSFLAEVERRCSG